MGLRACFLLLAGLSAVLPAEAGRWGWQEGRTFGGPGYAMASKRFVVIPRDAGETLLAAAADLAQAMEIRHGGTVRVIFSDWRRLRDAVYLGDVPAARAAGRVPADLAAGGFVIRWRGSRVFLAGVGEEGAANGAYVLAEEALGARWYWPGALGFELAPPVARVGPEPRFRREDPGFIMRWMHPLATAEETAFGRRNRLVRNHVFNHALFRVFDREAYARAPEAFAVIEGERRVPAGSGRYDPQPDFTSEAAVEVAAAAARRYFEENPGSNTFSLSINDNVLFDESEATREAVSPVRVFRDRPVYTDLVFAFMNRVAERVFDEAGLWTTAEGEPRFLTALAYYWTEAAPSIRLHPRVTPVLTSDRAQWHDPAYRAEDRALIADWGRSGAERIATWDYYFGSPYPYPRQFNRWIGESIPHLHAHGTRVFYSQLPSAWGLDGGKAWLAARLLWDPAEDWRALMDEFYERFFGPAAAPMRRFYERAEAHRDATAGPANWIKFYKDEAGIEHFTPEFCAGLRAELEHARAAAADDSRRLRRIEVVSEAFSLTEAYANFHFARRALVRLALNRFGDQATSGTSALDEAMVTFINARRDYYRLVRRLVESPFHHRLSAVLDLGQSDPVPLALAARALAAAAADAKSPAPLPEAVARNALYRANASAAGRWAGGGILSPALFENRSLRWEPGPPQPVNFLGPPVPAVPGWRFGFRPAPRFAIEPVFQGREGGRRSGVRMTGADSVSLFTAIAVEAGRDYLLRLRCGWRVSPDNRSVVRVDWFSEEGDELGGDLLFSFPSGESGPLPLAFPLRAPDGAFWMRLSLFLSRQYPGDHLSVEEADFRTMAAP